MPRWSAETVRGKSISLFGGVFAATLAALRDALGVPPPVAADMAARLRARLDAER